MTRTLDLTGFASGDSFSMSVTQDGQTVGPVTVPAWGQPQSGGTITIVADRTALQCAPDSVRFTVDLSLASFDAQGPVAPQIYDAQMHDLIYLWDFGDTGDWTAPVNVLPEWKARTYAKGPFVAHMYRVGGTYNVTLTVLEPSSGKSASTEVSIVVADPDAIYAGANTICVNPVGDADFTGAPSGATLLNLDTMRHTDQVWIDEQEKAGQRRWLFKRGGTFTLSLPIGALDSNNLMFGAYGSGARPILMPFLDGTNNNIMFLVTEAYQDVDGAITPDLRFSNLEFRGNYDPVSENMAIDRTNKAKTAISTLKYLDLMFSDCLFSGFVGVTLLIQPLTSNTPCHTHVDDCIITAFGGQYPTYFRAQTAPKTSVVFTGTGLVQSVGAVDDEQIRAPVRVNHAGLIHFRGCDVFHTDNSQPCLKLAETPQADGMIVNVHSCALEGGLWPLSFGNNAGQGLARSSVHNVVVDGIIGVAGHDTQAIIKTKVTGVTVRNCLGVQPAVPFALRRFWSLVLVGVVGEFDPAVIGAAPIRVFNNTLRVDRTTIQNGGDAWVVLDKTNGLFTEISESNTVLHMPNFDTPSVAFAPISSTALWPPRNVGRRNKDTYVLDPSYATPADAVKDSRPLVGSSALGAAITGDVSYQDILLQTRPEPPSQGAWEMK